MAVDNIGGVIFGDGTVVTTTWYDDGSPPMAVTTYPPGGKEANRQAITAKALAALDLNATFLAITAPTNAQVLAQVKLLTRQANALIRLRLGNGALDSTSGT